MTDTPARPRRNYLLVVSLCLNVALIGVIAGAIWRISHIDTSIGAGGPLAPHTVMAQFPARAPAISAIIDAHRKKLKELRHASVQARVVFFRALSAPDFDPKAMTQTLDAVAVADAALEAESLRMAGESLSALTAQERQALVDRVKKRNRSWPFRLLRKKNDE